MAHKARTILDKIEQSDDLTDCIFLPDKKIAAKTISAVMIKKAMEGNLGFIREVEKFLNLDPYINEEFEKITKLPLTEQHTEILKLFAKRCITEQQLLVITPTVRHAIDSEIVKKFDERLKALERKKKR